MSHARPLIMKAAAIHPQTDLFSYMVRSHQALGDLYDQLLEAMEVDAPNLRELWSQLDRGLISHMEAEERFVLPAFARVDREEAVMLIREHGQIRALLFELGVAIDLHELRYERSCDLVDLLRAHGGREDKLLYRWADKNLDPALATAAIAHAQR
jgi:hypothetical protein